MEKETITINGAYEGEIHKDLDNKVIYKLKCKCPDFMYRRIKKIGVGPDIKRFYSPCKHLLPYVKALLAQGYVLKEEKEEGKDYCTNSLRKKLIERSNGLCECGKCNRPGKYVHRIKRGSSGGKYSEENCKLLSLECHSLFHSNEFEVAKGK